MHSKSKDYYNMIINFNCRTDLYKLQPLAEVQYTTSEQHQQASGPRLVRDRDNDRKIYEFVKERHPFPDTTVLRNIVTGVEAGDHVYDAKTVGETILASMVGQNV